MDLPAFIKRQWTHIPAPTASFTCQTIIVTGSNIGLGLEAARHYVALDAAKVILAVRTKSKGEAAAADIAKTTGRAGICEVWELDMSNFDSVKAFAKRAAGLERLDAVMENAGIATRNYAAAEGMESTIAVNVVGTFLLALNLLPVLRASGKKFGFVPKLTIVSSEVHFMAKFNERNEPSIFETLKKNESKYMVDRYNVSKLLEVFTVRELAQRMNTGPHAAEKVVLNTLTPGFCHSSLTRDASGLVGLMIMGMKAVLARSTEVGARTLVASTAAGEESHGQYMSEGRVVEPSAFVRSEEGEKTQQRVWDELSTILEGIQPGVTSNI